MKWFQEFSSVKINVEKCEACWLGKARHRTTQPARCQWTSLTKSCIKILGMTFSFNKTSAYKENLNLYTLSLDCRTLLIDHMETEVVVSSWENSGFLVYLATIIDLQQNFRDTIKSLHKEFIWSGKRPEIKHATLIGDYREDGLKDIDMMKNSSQWNSCGENDWKTRTSIPGKL